MVMPDKAPSLLRIWLKPAHGAPVQPVDSARITEAGIVGDAQLGTRRPVTILSAERWAVAERELKAPVNPGLRKANLLVSGIALADTRGGSCGWARCACGSGARRRRAT